MDEIKFIDPTTKAFKRIKISSGSPAESQQNLAQLVVIVDEMDPNYWESLSPIQEHFAMQSLKKQLYS